MKTENRRINWLCLIINLAIPLAVGGVGALIGRGGMEAFEKLRQPPLSPPQSVFPIVWTVLYALMGVSMYLTVREDAPVGEKKLILWLYGVQLALNIAWTALYFADGLRLIAFVVLVVILALSIVMALRMARLRPLAGRLQIPYLVWLAFAGYLNMGVYLLNPGTI